MPAARTLVVLLVAAAALAGCGGNASDAAVRGVTTRFLGAIGSGDGTVACEQLSPQARSQLEQSQGSQCRAAVSKLGLKTGQVSSVRIYVMNAMVELDSGETEFLEQGAQGWRLTAVGCKPHGGRPVDEPYDCQLQD